jgi:hypothetical protein
MDVLGLNVVIIVNHMNSFWVLFCIILITFLFLSSTEIYVIDLSTNFKLWFYLNKMDHCFT